MRLARWLDHLPPWLAWLALLSTGIFEPRELTVMAAPLVLALGVEARRLALGPFQRWIQIGALVYAVALFLLRIPLLTGITYLLFLLCGMRLALPRALPQRRQILLMGFLLFLVAGLAVFELIFSVWLLAWLVLTAALLLQHAWEQSARNHPAPPPFRRIVPYAAAAALLAGLLFVVLPRLTFGMRPPWLPGLGWGRGSAGFSDRVELGTEGPVAPNADVVLRLVPRGRLVEDPDLARRAFGLLRGTALEAYDSGTWMPMNLTPRTSYAQRPFGPAMLEADVFLSPSPLGLIPHPYGILQIPGMDDLGIASLDGGGFRLRMPPRQVVGLAVRVRPFRAYQVPEPPPLGSRRALLTYPGEGTDAVHAWSQSVVPDGVPAAQAAEALATRLRTFRYTRDNPSGKAADPLRDFLLRTQAGHCEYFASALALMLRHRHVPARVVNGYQLGAWVPEGGYFVVTQNEAHSWVEYYDDARNAWQAVDATPPAPATPWAGEGLLARLQRWKDALQFRWDRHVVRFSDADQMAGFAWMQAKLEAARLPKGWEGPLRPLGWLAAVLLAARLAWRLRRHGWHAPWSRTEPGHLPQLKPLVRRLAGIAPPHLGETARTWLARLASLRPERAEALARLADLADAAAYARQIDPALAAGVAEEQRAWKGWKAPRPD